MVRSKFSLWKLSIRRESYMWQNNVITSSLKTWKLCTILALSEKDNEQTNAIYPLTCPSNQLSIQLVHHQLYLQSLSHPIFWKGKINTLTNHIDYTQLTTNLLKSNKARTTFNPSKFRNMYLRCNKVQHLSNKYIEIRYLEKRVGKSSNDTKIADGSDSLSTISYLTIGATTLSRPGSKNSKTLKERTIGNLLLSKLQLIPKSATNHD